MSRRFSQMTAVLFLFLLSLQIPVHAIEKVSFSSKDGPKLVGLFQRPQPGKPIIICLHGLASSKEEWAPFAEVMVDEGWGVLVYDARGHGQSSLTFDAKGNPNGFQSFGAMGPGSQWMGMIDDVGQAIKFARTESGSQDIPIYLMGASVGANVALIYTSLTSSVQKLVLLSPGLEYVAFKTEEPIKSVTCPILMVVSPKDSYAYQSVLRLKKIHPAATVLTDVKPGHGVQMFDDALLKGIGSWLDLPK